MHKPAISVKRPGLASAIKRPAGAIRSAGTNSGKNEKPNCNEADKYNAIHFSAGAMDEDTFIRSFEDVPTIQIYSSKEIVEEMRNILQIISDSSKDWNKRAEAVSYLFYFDNKSKRFLNHLL